MRRWCLLMIPIIFDVLVNICSKNTHSFICSLWDKCLVNPSMASRVHSHFTSGSVTQAGSLDVPHCRLCSAARFSRQYPDLFDVYSCVSLHKAGIYHPCTITNIGPFPTVTVDILSYYQALGYNINNDRTTSCRTVWVAMFIVAMGIPTQDADEHRLAGCRINMFSHAWPVARMCCVSSTGSGSQWKACCVVSNCLAPRRFLLS